MSKHLCIQELLKPFLQIGVTHAVYSPGSRNAPILHTLQDFSSISLVQQIDERSAAFVALGIAKSTQKPVILTCTSGSAVANYLPAVTEAFYSRIPLILITADRPSEAIDQWDGQAIRQKNLFKSHTRKSTQTPEEYDPVKFKLLGKEIAEDLQNQILGPVHINVPLAEPLYDLPEKTLQNQPSKINPPQTIEVDLSNVKGALVLHGMDDFESSSFEFTYANDAVVLADVTSVHSGNVQHWDQGLYQLMVTEKGRNSELCEKLRKKTLITTGNITVSKGLKLFLRTYQPETHYHLTAYHECGDPFLTKPQITSPQNSLVLGDEEVSDAWNSFDATLKEAHTTINWNQWNEFCAIKRLSAGLNNELLHSSSSMTIRYLSLLNEHQGPVYCNRGTSGIDGTTSTALGHALTTDRNVYLITGDLAFFYDCNALWTHPLPDNLKIIVMNNEGGGIFDLIDGPSRHPDYETLQVTPHQRSVKDTAASFQINYQEAKTMEDIGNAIEMLKASKFASILELNTNRFNNNTFFNQYKHLTS